MATDRRLRLASVRCFFHLCFLKLRSASVSAEVIEPFFVGGRHLLQNNNQCPHQWAFDNFTVLLVNCPYVTNTTMTYDKKSCCEDGLGAMLCPYAALVDDTTDNNSATSFFTTLQLVAPNDTSDWFPFICIDPNNPLGVKRLANLTSNETVSPPRNFAPGLDSFGLSLLLPVALFEILVLLFYTRIMLHDVPEDFYDEELRLVMRVYIRLEANFPPLEALIEGVHEDGYVAYKARPCCVLQELCATS